MILVEGSNVAENHPMAFEVDPEGARERGQDHPRRSADSPAHFRGGGRVRASGPSTDAAFQNTMINHIIVNKLYDKDYVLTHTNALYLGDEAFDFKDGVFSGYDEEHHKYATPKVGGYQLDAKGKPHVAKSLDDPHCKNLLPAPQERSFHVTRSRNGRADHRRIPADQIKQIAEMMAKNRPGSILYALGMTQHTTGVQGIRSFTILQLLLGNIGKPGGGVNALRGEPNVQGACDMAVLYNYMPGYLNSASNAEPTIRDYVRKNGIADSRYLVNTLKAFFGEAATTENDYAYAWLPKRDAAQGLRNAADVRGCSCRKAEAPLDHRPRDPAVTVPNLKLTFDAMAKLETLVVQEIWETETAAFWRRPDVDPKTISTEVIPAARRVLHGKERGTISNSGGMVQWRHAAVKPPGQAKSDGEVVDLVFRRYANSIKKTRRGKGRGLSGRRSGPIRQPRTSLREISGYALHDNPETRPPRTRRGDLIRKR